jgi:SsrA-binding protein
MAFPEIKNRKAFHDYKVLDKYEAGIVLRGTEIKSIRAGGAQFADAYAKVEDGDVTLLNLHIAPYEFGGYTNHAEDRPRRLLLNKSEIRRLMIATHQKGCTLIPLRLYFKSSFLKCELGICLGKKAFDKRETLRERDSHRQIRRSLKTGR